MRRLAFPSGAQVLKPGALLLLNHECLFAHSSRRTLGSRTCARVITDFFNSLLMISEPPKGIFHRRIHFLAILFTFLDKCPEALRSNHEHSMNSIPENLQKFADRLGQLRPAKAGSDLNSRLEASLRQADEELSRSRSIIYHPFAQRLVAAAALFVALLMAFQSTRMDSVPGEFAETDTTSISDPRPVYQQINGRLVPVSDESSLQQVKYRGIEVIDGRAYRHFRGEQQTFFQLVLTSPNSDEDVESLKSSEQPE